MEQKNYFYQNQAYSSQKFISILRGGILSILLFILSLSIAKADCTITSSINATDFLATYSGCTGTITIPNGVVLTMDASLSIPVGVNKIIIQNGGQISWTNGSNIELLLAENTSIVIENTSNTTGVLALSGACNNNDEIHIGAVQYAVCTGGGACIKFETLISNGGTIQINPVVVVTNGSQTGNTVCFDTFSLNAALDGFVGATPNFAWTQISGPGTSVFTTDNIQSPSITVSTPGNYTYRVVVTVALSEADGCLNTIVTANSDIDIIVSPCNVQPVSLISFIGKSTVFGNELKWVTSEEKSFSHFEIEKSKNASAFSTIAKISGNNKKENISYNYIDSNIENESYYRLKIVDLDGSSEFSKTIFVENKTKQHAVGEFYPNPSIENEVSIDVYSSKNSSLTISNYDMFGKMIGSEIMNLNTGQNLVKIAINKLNKGLNIIGLEIDGNIQYRKLIR